MPVLLELPMVKLPVEVAILPFTVSVLPDAAAKPLAVPAVKLTSPARVTLLEVPVSNKVPPPKLRPPVALLILDRELNDKVPPLIFVAPV